MILKMLVIEAYSSDIHVVNALHAENFTTMHADDAIAADIEVTIAAACKIVVSNEVITKATMVPISARLSCDWAFPWG